MWHTAAAVVLSALAIKVFFKGVWVDLRAPQQLGPMEPSRSSLLMGGRRAPGDVWGNLIRGTVDNL